jgi:ABC-type nitrate/sulfonate/bicarbonate transport system substrate-binding protein
VAEDQQAGASGVPAIKLLQFKASSDIGYALLSGDLDAGLVEPDRAESLLEKGGSAGLKVAGEVQFPYGATVVLRKDLSLRLSDLEGRKVAAEGDDCELYHQFAKNAQRLGVDLKRVEMVYMPFDEMIPALEAKVVDAIVTKGSYGVISEALGHKILYQKWDIAVGHDECCPAILAQTAYFLVVRPVSDADIARLVQRLEATNQIKPSEARALVCKRIGIQEEQLSQLPVASFSPLTDKLRSYLKNQAWNQKQ